MCGVCGIFRFDGKPVSQEELSTMNRQMIHRGPDDEGYFLDNSFGFAMRRLSIIDITGGHQPISNEDERYYIILNGEIYNYIELKRELIKKGHRFSTNSDTEVIAHLFEEYGPKCVEKLNGMFAFAVWDNIKKELFLFRDRIGIKPLFYTEERNCFIFSSDLSAITLIKPYKKEINFKAFLLYLGLSYIPYPWSIFKDIYKLEPGHYIRVNKMGDTIIKKYWDLKEFETLHLPSREDYHDLILDLLRDSIRFQMRSDVPIGTFLSGGIDSSCVVALLAEQVAQPIRTFSVGFQGGVNELPYAKLVADKFKTDHSEFFISAEDILTIVPGVIDKLDEPLSDNAMIPTLMLSKIAIKEGVKVVLNGTGGDEIFGGYYRYLPHRKMWKIMNSLPTNVRKLAGKLIGLFDTQKGFRIADPMFFFIISMSGVNFSFAENLFNSKTHFREMLDNITSIYRRFVPANDNKTKIHQLMYLDVKDYLVGDVLSVLDKMTMAVSLEGRVPLLDHRIVEMSFKIPDKIKFGNGQLKGLLKGTLKDVLPHSILHLPKAGFAGPVKHWVNTSLKKSLHSHLVEKPIPFFQEHLNNNIIKHTLDDSEKYWRYSMTLFSLYIFSLWYKRHIEGQEIDI